MIFSESKARQNFEETSNRTFSFEDFSYKVVRLFFDQLHHVTTNEISLLDALELMVLCNHQGQIDQKSDFETRLYKELRHQILTQIKDSKQLCHIWMFLRSWGPSGWDSNIAYALYYRYLLRHNFHPTKLAIVLEINLLKHLMKTITTVRLYRSLLAHKRNHVMGTLMTMFSN